MDAQPSGESAPYGMACAGCSKAKCRCIRRGQGLGCDRCDRLQKRCEPSTTVRKRLHQRPARRTAQLEEKLEDLVTLLRSQASNQNNGNTTSSQSQSPDDQNAAPADNHPPQTQPPRETLPNQSNISTHSSNESHSYEKRYSVPPIPPHDGQSYSGATSSHSEEPSTPHDEEYLRFFRENHLRAFPFIFIPEDTTADHLRQERPFLWLNIKAISCKSISLARRLEVQIREVFAQRLLVDLDRNIDLLLGILTYLAWMMEKYRGKPLLVAYSSLASSLVVDLRLDRPLPHFQCRDGKLGDGKLGATYGYPITDQNHALNPTNEGRRATLGYFIVCSNISSFLKGIPPEWTPKMEETLEHLSQVPETPGDELLVALVKLFKIDQDITRLSPTAQCQLHPAAAKQAQQPPTSMYIKALKANVEMVKNTTPAWVQSSKIFLSHVHATNVMINEVYLHDVSSSESPGFVNMDALDCFYGCLRSVRDFYDNLFLFTPEEVFSFPFAFPVHFSRCTQALFKLICAESPAWDKTAIPGVIDVMGTLERCAEVYGGIPAAIGLDTDGTDLYSKCVDMFKMAVPTWQKAMIEAGILQTPLDANAVMAIDRDLDFLAAPGDTFEMFNWWDSM